MKIVTTWDGGGEFTAAHVLALKNQCAIHAPLDEFVCITNEKIPGVTCWPNVHKWPGWWVKMEAFAPSIKGTILYMDIDTVVCGSLEDIVRVEKLTMLRDFYRNGKRRWRRDMFSRSTGPASDGLQASLMLLPETDRVEPYQYFINNTALCMEKYRVTGDQVMLEKSYLTRAQRWQDILPGQCVSWKVDCDGGNEFRTPVIPLDARVIIFHGKPRPWDVPQFKELYK